MESIRADKVAADYATVLKYERPKDKEAFIAALAKRARGADVQTVIDFALVTPMHTHPMRNIVPYLVVHLRDRGLTRSGDALNDPTLSVEAYLDIAYARNRSPGSHAAQMSLTDLLATLKRCRSDVRRLYELLRSLPPGDLRRFVLHYFQRSWKMSGIAALKAIKALTTGKQTAVLKGTYGMTKDPVLLAQSVVSGRVPPLSGRLGADCVQLNKTVCHTARQALEALPGACKRREDGTVVKKAIATVKLDGYSVNLCFYRDDDADRTVRYRVQFRTRGQTWSIGAGMASIAGAMARAFQQDPAFDQLIVGGEVCVADSDTGVMLPSVDMHDWKRADRMLVYTVYHVLLHGKRLSGSASADLDVIDAVLTDALLERVHEDTAFGSARLRRITEMFEYAVPGGTRVMPMTASVEGELELEAFFARTGAAGAEGLVLTNRETALQFGDDRNQNVVKMKPEPTVLEAVVYGFKLRGSGHVKELMVAVTDGKTAHAYATVGNLNDAARRSLPTALAERFTCKPGHDMTSYPSWFTGPPTVTDVEMQYLIVDSCATLPTVRIRGYPSQAVSRKYPKPPPAWELPNQLTFAKLVPESLAGLIDATHDEDPPARNAWAQGDGFKALLDSLDTGFTTDTDALVGVTVSIKRPTQQVALKDTVAYTLALDLARMGAKVVVAGNDADYAIDPDLESHRTWVVQCVVFDKECDFPRDTAGIAFQRPEATVRTFTCRCGDRRVVIQNTIATQTTE